MKKIHIIATSDRKIFTVACPSDIPTLLRGATIEKEWFYEQPKELYDFFKTNPDQLTYFLKGFSYWIESKVKGFGEKTRYQKLKRIIKEFSQTLLEKIRGLSTRIAKEVKTVVKSKKEKYKEEKRKQRIYERISSY